ncbi:protein-glutamate methylesterase/protein-glutamine glutaminase [Yunchengibacter salinarum]|uniref:protein-glutamate methylesterase/protein-glutamine glutaminase n=1 Tax=Yunchengibacter salinarum TaxID=3133399 RepID=UPI0035B67471
MVVDDSAIVRGFLTRYLEEDPEIQVVTTASNGSVALRQLEANAIEVVVLDIEMPVMDGMEALPRLLAQQPDVQVVMASTLTKKNADISLRALQSGAVDYVPKPETARSVNSNIDFRTELVEKVKVWAKRRRNRRGEKLPGASARAAPANDRASGFVTARQRSRPVVSEPAAAAPARERAPDRSGPVTLRKGSSYRPQVIGVGSSTGGPQALMKFFARFSAAPKVPVLVTQHMPATFTAILANHIGQATGWPCSEAIDGEEVHAGHVYVAQGGKHLVPEKEGGVVRLRLTETPPENFCRPAVDPMFRGLVDVYGDRVLAVILTGMGHDGLKGSREVVRAGGTVVAQDEATSVVWGMPGAVATAGLCSNVLPLEDLGDLVAARARGELT